MNPFTPHFMSLFDGHKEAYGKFNFEDKIREDGKVKGSGITVRKHLTTMVWDDHITGKTQLGVIPINSENMTKFGAIDVDDYSVDDIKREAVNFKIEKSHLPLIQFRSKSGGIHLFLFTTDFVKAELMQQKLKILASFLGFGSSEIFPKQTTILKERGDVGQWINMPYFNGDKGDRYAFNEKSEPLHMADFIRYALDKRISPENLAKFKVGSEQHLEQGPPCLQHLIQQGFPEGTRNNGLYNLGIYTQKAFGDDWKQKVDEYNNKYLKPPLAPAEVLTIVKSIEGKDYNYSCQKQPICSFCNQSLCRTRKYGIGQSAGLPVMGSLTKLDCEPPIWFLEIENGDSTKRLELTTEDLQKPERFQKRCLDTLSIMPPVLSRNAWQVVVSELLQNINVIPMPKEYSPAGMLISNLQEFCINRTTEDDEGLLRALVLKRGGEYFFRFRDFLQFLERKKFTELPHNKILSVLRDFGMKRKQHNISSHSNIAICYIPVFEESAITEFHTPEQIDNEPF